MLDIWETNSTRNNDIFNKELNLTSPLRVKIRNGVWQAEVNTEFVSDASKKFDMKAAIYRELSSVSL